MKLYKDLLIEAGFKEAIYNPNHYFRKETEKTAMVINLKSYNDIIGVLYGFCSTAFWDENWMEEQGIRDCDCNLREYVEIKSENVEVVVKEIIYKFYQKYCNLSKDELLCVVKEKRKNFMKEITSVLKPLGFKKKGNQWNKQLDDSHIFAFYLNKNTYSDLYYFESGIYSVKSSKGMWCYGDSLYTGGTDIFDWKAYGMSEYQFDWQLQSTEEIHKMTNDAIEQHLQRFLYTSLSELGTKKDIWEGCICSRDCCEECWVQKNMWEIDKDEKK